MAEGKYEDWMVVFQSGRDYEADIVRDRLDDAGIPAVVLTQRDHVFNLNIGDLSDVNVLVPPDKVDQARSVLDSEPFSEEELSQAALSANPSSPPAHDRHREAMLDSGAEEISLSPPDDEDLDDDTSA